MTRRAFTVSLREAVASIPGFTKKMALAYSGHSPRSGLPSLVQGKNLDESVMKAFGRWSSSSYLLYMKDQEAQRKGKKAVADACYQLALTVAGGKVAGYLLPVMSRRVLCLCLDREGLKQFI